jgi:hypothetical protein
MLKSSWVLPRPEIEDEDEDDNDYENGRLSSSLADVYGIGNCSGRGGVVVLFSPGTK